MPKTLKLLCYKIHLKFAYFIYYIYQIRGLTEHDICEICLKMFNTRNGYGGWSDITSCAKCGPTEEDMKEAAR